METNGRNYKGYIIRKIGDFNSHYEVKDGCFKRSFYSLDDAKDFIDRKEKGEEE